LTIFIKIRHVFIACSSPVPLNLFDTNNYMLTNYLKIALRSLLKFKGYAAINLFGLALGLTAGIMIMLYVLDEISYDQFHANKDRLYRVETLFTSNGTKSAGLPNETNAWPIGNILRKDYPEVEAVLYTRNASILTVNFEDKRITQKIHYASPEFFSMFSFPLIKGNPEKALNEPLSIVISEDMEKKYFPNESALNKTLTLGDTLQFVVTGVAQNVPKNSHIQFDMLISFSTYTTVLNKDFSYDGGWGNINMRNYVLLKRGADVANFAEKAKSIYQVQAGQMLKDWGVSADVVFSPFSSLYLNAKSNGMGTVGSIDRLYLMSGIAAFVILLACINFINLTTARSVYRAKEVGLRKVVGSTRSALMRQFLSESFVLSILALFIALTLTGLALPFFNQLLGKSYSISSIADIRIVVGIICLVIAISFLSGYYPAWVMSSLKPVEVLKGKLQSAGRGVRLRQSLVVFQFVISVCLVMGTLVVIDQLHFMQSQDLGFAKDQIFVVRADRVRSPDPLAFESFRNEIQTLAIVENVSFTNSLPGNPGWQGQVAYPEGRSGDYAISVEYMAIDENYVNTLGLSFVAGHGFDKQREAELNEGLILNETAVKKFGWASPQEAIGKKITSPSQHPAGEVIGVLKDYHQLGLQQNVGPMTMDYNSQYAYLYAVRFKGENAQALVESISKLWKKRFSGYDFNYFFLDQDFEKQYQAETRLANVFAVFAVITIIIAMIGLVGLVSFMVASRTKEIGIRKVLGAEVMSISSLLSKEFLTLVIVANLIAFPLAWYFADKWLQNFANRMEVRPMIFISTLLIAVGITLVTISFQTIKAAMTDPVKSLRYE
jgi:putative ABC transport system permease protein